MSWMPPEVLAEEKPTSQGDSFVPPEAQDQGSSFIPPEAFQDDLRKELSLVDAAYEQTQYRPQEGIRGKLARMGQAVNDITMDMAAGTVRLFDLIPHSDAAGTPSITPEEFAQKLEGLKKYVADPMREKQNPAQDEDFSSMLATGAAQFLPQIAGQVVGVGPVANAGQFYQQEYSAAKEKGASDSDAKIAGLLNLPGAALDYLMEKFIVGKFLPHDAPKTIGSVAKALGFGAVGEGLTETAQNEWSNFIAGNLLKYDESRSLQEQYSAKNLGATMTNRAKVFGVAGILGGAGAGLGELSREQTHTAEVTPNEFLPQALQTPVEETPVSQPTPKQFRHIVPEDLTQMSDQLLLSQRDEIGKTSPEQARVFQEEINRRNQPLVPLYEEPQQVAQNEQVTPQEQPTAEVPTTSEATGETSIPPESTVPAAEATATGNELPKSIEGDPRLAGLKYNGEQDYGDGPVHYFTDTENNGTFIISGELTADKVAAKMAEQKTRFEQAKTQGEAINEPAQPQAEAQSQENSQTAGTVGEGTAISDLTSAQNELAKGLEPLREQLVARAEKKGVEDPQAVASDAIQKAIKPKKDGSLPTLDEAGKFANSTAFDQVVSDAMRKQNAHKRTTEGGGKAVSVETPIGETSKLGDTISDTETTSPDQQVMAKERATAGEFINSQKESFVKTLTTAEKRTWDKINQETKPGEKPPRISDKDIEWLGTKFRKHLVENGMRGLDSSKAQKTPDWWRATTKAEQTKLEGAHDFSSVNALLKSIAVKSRDPSYRALARVLSKKNTKGITLKLESDGKFRNSDGQYGWQDGKPTLVLNMDNIKDVNNLERVALHESVHAFTLDLIDLHQANPKLLTPKQRASIGQMQKILDKARAHIIGDKTKVAEFLQQAIKDPVAASQKTEIPYGLTSLSEFATESMSQPEFQALLKNIPFEAQNAPKSLWSAFIEAIKNLFNARKGSALDAATANIADLIDMHKGPSRTAGPNAVFSAPNIQEANQRSKDLLERKPTEALSRVASGMEYITGKWMEWNYVPTSYADQEQFADRQIAEWDGKGLGLEGRVDALLAESGLFSGIQPLYKAAIGARLLDSLVKEGKSTANPLQLDRLGALQLKLMDGMAQRGSDAGQALWTFKYLADKMSPLGFIKAGKQAFQETIDQKLPKGIKRGSQGIVDAINAINQGVLEGKPMENLISKYEVSLGKFIWDNVNLRALVNQHFMNLEEAGVSLTDKLISETDLSFNEASKIAIEIERVFQQEAGKEKAKQLEALLPKEKKAQKAVKEALPEIIRLSNLGALNQEAYYNAVAEKLGLPTWNKQVSDEIMRQANDIQLMPDGSNQRKFATQQLHNYIAKQSGLSWKDVVQGYWYAAILSGTGTQAFNLVATFTKVQTEAIQMAALSGDIQGALSVLYSNITAMPMAKANARAALTMGDFTGQAAFEATQSARELELLSQQGKEEGVTWKRLLGSFKYVSRLMAAADILNAGVSKEARLRLLAYKESRAGEPSLSFKDRQKAIDAILKRTAADKLNAEIQANEEGWGTGTPEFARRVLEIQEANIPSKYLDQARGYSLDATYNQKPMGWLGNLAFAVETVTGYGNKSGKYVVPFTRIVANVANDWLNYTPIGAGRAIYAAAANDPDMAKERMLLPSTASEIDIQMFRAKVLTSAALYLGLGALILGLKEEDKDREVDLIGSGPRDPEKKRQFLATGAKPYSVKVGNRYVNYAATPFAMPLAMLGNIRDAQKYGGFREKEMMDKFSIALMGSVSVISDMSFIQGIAGLGTLFTQPYGPESAGKNLENMLVGIPTGLYPNLFKEVEQIIVPERPANLTAAETMLAKLPIVGSIMAKQKPKLDMFGEPVTIDLPTIRRFMSKQKDEPAYQIAAALQQKGVFINVIESGKFPDGTKMTKQDVYNANKVLGKRFKAFVTDPETAKALLEADPEEAKRIISQFYNDQKDSAKAESRESNQ